MSRGRGRADHAGGLAVGGKPPIGQSGVGNPSVELNELLGTDSGTHEAGKPRYRP